MSEEIIQDIVRIQLKHLEQKLKAQQLNLSFSDEIVAQLAQAGWDPQFGARPLRRAVQEWIEVPLSMALLNNQFGQGETILIQQDKTGESFEFKSKK